MLPGSRALTHILYHSVGETILALLLHREAESPALPAVPRPKDAGVLRARDLEEIALSDELEDLDDNINNDDDDDDDDGDKVATVY